MLSWVEMKQLYDNLTLSHAELSSKVKQLRSTKIESKQISKKYKSNKEEVKEIKNILKRNMSLIEARQVIWDDIIQHMCSTWGLFQVIVEGRVEINSIIEVVTSCKKDM